MNDSIENQLIADLARFGFAARAAGAALFRAHRKAFCE